MDQVQIQRLRNVFFCFGSNIWTKTLLPDSESTVNRATG